jgi:hypothetical protein
MLIGAIVAASALGAAGLVPLGELDRAGRTTGPTADPFYCLVITDPQGKPIKTICVPKPFTAPAAAAVG